MNLKIKDFIYIAAVTVLTFPILYLTMMFITGAARIEFGSKKEEPEQKIEMIQRNHRKDSLSIVNSKTFQALQQEKYELQKERERLSDKQRKIDLLEKELQESRQTLEKERKRIEKLVSRSDSLDLKKIKDLSKIYGAMRPVEAAQIIETLQDELAVKVLTNIGDERQKGKILSAMSREKATRISKLISKL
jgi:flagellar motility protein MotE (MotC chaperone)